MLGQKSMGRHERRPKRITPQQITGQQGVNLVEQAILDMGFTWHPTNAGLEGGIDGFIEIRHPSTGELTNNILQVQVKTTQRLWISETDTEFTYLCKERDIDYWMQGNTPVILVAVRPEGGEAYWVEVKQAFSDTTRRLDRHVRFDKKSQRFDRCAGSTLMKLAVPKDAGFCLPASSRNETLISNLLEVKAFPPSIYVAATEYRKPQEVFEWAKSRGIQLPSGWVLADKGIRSIYDLREKPWVDLVDRGTIERLRVEDWAITDDPDRHREFVWLMNQVLRQDLRISGMWHSRDENCFYFPAHRDHAGNPLPREYEYRSLEQRTSRELVQVHRHPETQKIAYCRHSAFKCEFVRVDGRWFLSIVPHYVYTTDGKLPYAYGDDLLSGMKRMEHQEAVLGQILMWKYRLTHFPARWLFDAEGERRPVLSFGELLQAECDRGVNDGDWLRTDTMAAETGADSEPDTWELF
jgi:hypothetical protein